jgi:hypothetical protein
MKSFILYIDIASIINDNDKQMEVNTIRKQQFINGLKKLFEYDYKKYNCDILITDNTCTDLYPELQELLPEGTIVRCFNKNHVGSINKGAGLIQKWLYNEDILRQYEWIIHFEGRQLLHSFEFMDRFFTCPQTYFRYGNPFDKSDVSNFYTGLFSAKVNDLFHFCSLYPFERLLKYHISIEYPIRDVLIDRATTVERLHLRWFPACHDPIDF